MEGSVSSDTSILFEQLMYHFLARRLYFRVEWFQEISTVGPVKVQWVVGKDETDPKPYRMQLHYTLVGMGRYAGTTVCLHSPESYDFFTTEYDEDAFELIKPVLTVLNPPFQTIVSALNRTREQTELTCPYDKEDYEATIVHITEALPRQMTSDTFTNPLHPDLTYRLKVDLYSRPGSTPLYAVRIIGHDNQRIIRDRKGFCSPTVTALTELIQSELHRSYISPEELARATERFCQK